MTSKAFGLAQLGNVFDDGALSNRNLIINGAMQVAQRGTSASPASLFAYNTADRARLSGNSFAGTVDQSIVTGQNVGDFVGNALKTTITSAGASGSLAGYNYRIEPQDINMFDGKTMTFSFYAKADAATSLTFSVSGDSVMVSSVVIPLTTSWQRFTQTFTYSSTTSASFVDLTLRADGTILTSHYLTGVQLEIGDTSTSFEHELYSVTLQKCQRYFTRIDGQSEHIGQNYSGSSCDTNISIPVTMRATPTFSCEDTQNTANTGSIYSSGAYNYGISAALNSGRSRNNQMLVRLTGALSPAGSQDDCVQIQFNDLQFDAEL
jgi:hypothetical protein